MITSSYDAVKDELVCVFSGRMDAVESRAVSEGFEAAWNAAQTERAGKEGGMQIVFDLAGVDFLSSAFFRLCVMAGKKPGGGKLRVVNTTPTVKKLFTIAGLDLFIN